MKTNKTKVWENNILAMLISLAGISLLIYLTIANGNGTFEFLELFSFFMVIMFTIITLVFTGEVIK